MLNAPPSDLESQKRSLLCSKHSAWLMDPNNQHSVQCSKCPLKTRTSYACPSSDIPMSHRAPETWTHRLAAWHVAEIEETVFNPPITDIRASNRQTNMILNVRIVYWIRIVAASDWHLESMDITIFCVSSLKLLCWAFAADAFSHCMFVSLSVFSFVFNNWNARSAGLKSGDWLCRWKSLDFFASRHSTLVFLLYALGHYRFTQWSTVPSVLQYLSEQSL